ncbi:MAG: UDP-N-acetylmuramate dehydrogenase [Gammaproteobacteria bacterium]|nr:UDP-N-acetylmuramate dehydrogenase [Gammaproteobacteria bacterium]
MNSKTLRGELQSDAPLSKLNTWFVGGNAKQLYLPADVNDLSEFLKQLPLDDEPIFIGLGSNVLIRDGGIPNTVILTQGRLNKLELDCRGDQRVAPTALPNHKIFYAQAGVTCAKVAKFCVANNMVQGEFFAGIPGTVGGALAMNAGAFGGETWPRVVAVETIDRLGKVHLRTADEYQISYRTVIAPAKEWFVGAYFQLPIGDGKETQQRIKALLAKRKESQPIGLPSCGSVFKNPPGDHAARLIEVSGLKGYRIGGAEISPKHANFIINIGDATAQDIEMLIHYVQEQVAKKHQIQLVTEVHILGVAKESKK